MGPEFGLLFVFPLGCFAASRARALNKLVDLARGAARRVAVFSFFEPAKPTLAVKVAVKVPSHFDTYFDYFFKPTYNL